MSNESQLSSTEAVNTPCSTTRAKNTKMGFSTVLIWLVVILAVLALAWWGKRYLETVQHNLQQETQQLNAALTTAQTQLYQQNQRIDQFQQQLHQLQSQNQTRASWFLAKAEYLIKLAAFNITFQNDTLTAEKILVEADNQLQGLNNPSVWPARQALAADIAKLTATPQVDLPGIISRIGIMSQQIEQLPRIPTMTLQAEQLVKPTATPKTPLDKLKAFAFAVSNNLKDFMVIQYDAPTGPPLLPPDQYQYIVTNMQFQLSMAQWAALHQQPTVYQESLNHAATWLRRYYSSADVAVKNILTNLDELQATSVKPAAVDLSQSLQAIHTALANVAKQ